MGLGVGAVLLGAVADPAVLCPRALISLYLVAVRIKSVLVAASHFPLRDLFVLLLAAGRC